MVKWLPDPLFEVATGVFEGLGFFGSGLTLAAIIGFLGNNERPGSLIRKVDGLGEGKYEGTAGSSIIPVSGGSIMSAL